MGYIRNRLLRFCCSVASWMLCYIAPSNHSCDVGRPWILSAEEAKGLLSSSPTKHAAAQLGALMHIAGVLSRTMNIAANKALSLQLVAQ